MQTTVKEMRLNDQTVLLLLLYDLLHVETFLNRKKYLSTDSGTV